MGQTEVDKRDDALSIAQVLPTTNTTHPRYKSLCLSLCLGDLAWALSLSRVSHVIEYVFFWNEDEDEEERKREITRHLTGGRENR